MATTTAQASGTTAPDNWTLSAGASKAAAVAAPNDDATSYVDSLNTINTQQRWTYSPSLMSGDTITQIAINVRYKRGGTSDANFTLTYGFTPNGGGSQTGTSGTFTSTSTWQSGTATFSGLSVVWGSGFYVQAENTQGRRVQISTLEVVITYTAAAGGGTMRLTLPVRVSTLVGGQLAA